MSGTSKFQQLHGVNVTPDIAEALEARVKDPLWFLARQWQMGEFEAESGGTPMLAILRARLHALDRVRLGGGAIAPLDPRLPLEAVVEPEPEPGAGGEVRPAAWRPESLSYAFALFSGNARLEAAEYGGRWLDWHDFDLVDRQDKGGVLQETVMTPGQLQIPGAPEPRWWRIEAGAEYFDGAEDPEPNVLSLLLPEFFHTDVRNWYVLPAPMPAGHLRRMEAVEIVDSFGVVTRVDPVVGPHDPGADADDDWALFALSGGGAAGDLYLAPNVAVSVGQNDLVEEVRYLRDEAANLVWAWERQLTDAAGVLYQTSAGAARGVAAVAAGEAVAAGAEMPAGDLPQFRLMSEIDPAWIPYLPQQIADVPALDGEIALRRARSHESYSRDNPQYRGRIVAETPALAEEEVPPGGITVKRQHRYAVDSEGRVHFWIGRSKDVASPAKKPRLRFDYLVPPATGGEKAE